jgi:hypothetical protein
LTVRSSTSPGPTPIPIKPGISSGLFTQLKV